MSYCFNFLVCLAAIILQTAIFPHFRLLGQVYDLLVPFVIYLGLYRPVGESLVGLLLAGMLMGGLSAGAFGLYLTAYLWMYLGAIWMVRYLHLVNRVLLPLVLACGVLFQNLVFFAGAVLTGAPVVVNSSAVLTVLFQLLLAVLTGPFILLFLRRAHSGWQHWAERLLTRRNGVVSR
jgi:hypothetical protein